MTDGLHAAGLTVRDIQAHLLDLHGLKVSPDLISRVTDAVLDEVREWQNRALDRMYPIVIVDALRVKIRDADSRMVKNKAVYIALGVIRDGLREVLGLWIAESWRGHKTVQWTVLPDNGRQVLAVGDERVEEPGCSGHPDRGRRRAEGECPELCVSGPVHAVSDTQASKRSPNIMANWLRAANHSRTFRPSFSKLRMAR